MDVTAEGEGVVISKKIFFYLSFHILVLCSPIVISSSCTCAETPALVFNLEKTTNKVKF
jgi:hypothetical protein